MSDKEFEDFIQSTKKELTRHSLHTLAEERLKSYLLNLFPHDYAGSEVSLVPGGRNDLILFLRDGHRTVFEFFFSPSQVPQDLRLLEQAEADTKVAILLNREFNPKLAYEYFHKKPNHFPYLWLSSLLIPSHEERCLLELRKLTKLFKEDPSFNPMILFLPDRPLAAGDIIKGEYEISDIPTDEIIHKIASKLLHSSGRAIPLSCCIDTRPNKGVGRITVQY
jgi:hypothetical protein